MLGRVPVVSLGRVRPGRIEHSRQSDAFTVEFSINSGSNTGSVEWSVRSFLIEGHGSTHSQLFFEHVHIVPGATLHHDKRNRGFDHTQRLTLFQGI